MNKKGVLATEANRQEFLNQFANPPVSKQENLFQEYGEIAYQINLHKAALVQLEEVLEDLHIKLSKLQPSGDYRETD